MTTEELVEERGSQYGHPKQDFSRTAKLWNAYLGDRLVTDLKPEDVPMMMILLKVSREAHKHQEDNINDIQGYAKTRQMLEE
jgi:hypothetical protein